MTKFFSARRGRVPPGGSAVVETAFDGALRLADGLALLLVSAIPSRCGWTAGGDLGGIYLQGEGLGFAFV